MPIEEAVLDHRVVGGAPASEGMPPQLDVVVVAARNGMIDAWLDVMRAANLQPIGIDLSAFGLIRALGDALRWMRARRLLHSLLQHRRHHQPGGLVGRACLFTRVSPVGLEDIVASLTGATGLSHEHAQQWLAYVGLAQSLEAFEGDPETISRARAALESGASALLDELRLSLDFYSAQEGAVPIERIVLSGPGSTVPGLVERMEPALGLPNRDPPPRRPLRTRRGRGGAPHALLRTGAGGVIVRPVNLIPEHRKQDVRKRLRSGPLAYIVVAALVAVLLGVTALVVTGNEVSDRETEIAQLQREDAAARARASQLAGYTQFHGVSQQRVATVTSLADSRFDWERVMRELTLVLPGDVWLTDSDRDRHPRSHRRRIERHRDALFGPGSRLGAVRLRWWSGIRRRTSAGTERDRRRHSRWGPVLRPRGTRKRE